MIKKEIKISLTCDCLTCFKAKYAEFDFFTAKTERGCIRKAKNKNWSILKDKIHCLAPTHINH